MRLASLLAVAALALGLAPIACASADTDGNVVTPPEEGNAEDELRSFSLTEADNGKTVTVTEGQNVVVKLKSNPSTGYSWKVVSTDRSFGYPTTRHTANGGAVGSGGVDKFTWKTRGALPLVGEHSVKMEYKRAWETDPASAPAETFEFTVKIVAGECPELAPPSPDFCRNGEIKAKKNEQGCTVGFECVAACGDGCGAGRSCQYCWGHMACVPNGAMC
jgi:inhibitor of cysteine peptidase